jgi:hypothetical protein
MPGLPELYYSAETRHELVLLEFDWYGFLDTVVFIGMRRPTLFDFVGQEPCLPLAHSSVKRECLLKSHCAS